MMYCTECGKENVDNAIFCKYCGTKIAIPIEEQLSSRRKNGDFNQTESKNIVKNEHHKNRLIIISIMAVIFAIIAILILGIIYLKKEKNTTIISEKGDQIELTISMLKNAHYSIVDSKDMKVNLINGKYEKSGPGGITDTESVWMGDSTFGDLNNDGRNDAAVILYHNSGGTCTTTQIAAVLNIRGQPKHIASRDLGDRTEIEGLTIKDGYIITKVNNPRFFPGQGKTVKYKLNGEKLVGPEPFK